MCIIINWHENYFEWKSILPTQLLSIFFQWQKVTRTQSEPHLLKLEIEMSTSKIYTLCEREKIKNYVIDMIDG